MDVPTMLDIFESYGFETDDEMTEDRKMEALNETYWDACDRNGWTFLEASVTLTFSGGSGIPNNDPGDIGQVITANRVVDGATLDPWRLDDFYESYGGTASLAIPGSPMLYFFENGQINFYPVPQTSDSVLVKYIRLADELTATSVETDIRFPKRYHRSVLVMGTLSKLAVMQDDPDLGAIYERLYEKALNGMVDAVLKQQSQRSDFIHVNDQDNWDYS
jgi:hypothetical protein